MFNIQKRFLSLFVVFFVLFSMQVYAGQIQGNYKPLVFGSIAELKLSSPTADGQVCTVLGYSAATENRVWSLQWSASSSTSDDGGLVFELDSAPATGRWIRLLPDYIIYAEYFGLSTTKTPTENATILNNIIDNVSAGQTISFLDESAISFATTWEIDKSLIVDFNGKELLYTGADEAIEVTVSNCTFKNGKLTGPQFATAVFLSRGFFVHGADSSNYITGITFENFNVNTFGNRGFLMEFVEDFQLTALRLSNFEYAAMTLWSCQDGVITDYRADNVVDTDAGLDSYGISFSRQAGTLVAYPRCSDIVLDDFIISNVPVWEGVDTHGGENLLISNGTIRNTHFGVNLGPSDNAVSVASFAPKNIKVINVYMDSGVTDGTRGSGILFSGASGVENAENMTATGCTIVGYGDENTIGSSACGIWFRGTSGTVINGNVISKSGPYGIQSDSENFGYSITSNVIADCWSDTNAAYGVYVDDANQSGLIEGNVFSIIDSTFLATKTFTVDAAIRIDSVAGADIRLGFNFSQYDLYHNGTSDGLTQDITGPGAIDLNYPTTLMITTGADAYTLVNGYEGQRKIIHMKTYGGDGTLTPDGLRGFATITFDTVNDWIILVFSNGAWNVEKNSGCTLA